MTPIFQKPNKPSIIATMAFLVFAVAPSPYWQGALCVFVIGATIWSWLEITDGDSRFRQVLGYAVMIATAVLLYEILTGRIYS